jgi:uncharacterized protein GlcG (DUF336 family)
MSDLSRRPGNQMSRRDRADRAYNLVLVGGGASVVAVAGVVLAAIGVVGAWLPVIAVLIAVACFVMFRRTVGR